MTIRTLLEKSFDSAGFLGVLSGLFMVFGPRAQSEWENRLAREAAAACEQHGGKALVGGDRVVRCLPTVSDRRQP